ncbi:MAG: silent information regulator protein Sir2 [Moraxellaceae bacterium]|jgi:NAD-dependent deacetylase|nr:silent information regulator protein Sir2 [Moraxellaceae bacterium]
MSVAPPRIVVLTGAGISAESGIRTFRAQDGLWEEHRLEDVATPEAFARDPALVQRFYNLRRAQLQDPAVRPNAAHAALARLEREHPGEVLVVTQNVDNLHERAGTQQLLHMHGELLSMFCTHSGARFAIAGDITAAMPCACCGRTGTLRPDIVWFGETPYHMEAIAAALQRCTLFLSIGTSGNVYPAAGFVAEARRAGARTIELNLEPSLTRTQFAEHRYGPATEVVPALVEELLA